ncbi:MAG TPA: PLP-dependent aminotransferase family protein [Solirubrobacteraceae bacterium]
MPQGTSTDTLRSALRDTVQGMRPGERLPATREISARHRVSPVTVSRALAGLRAEGVIVTRPGSGTFVAQRRPSGPAEDLDASWQTVALGDRTVDAASVAFLLAPRGEAGAISLAGGYPHPSLLPTRPLAAALARAARRPDAAERPPLEGIAGLRSWFAESVNAALGPEDVLITTGGQSALSAAFRAIVPAGGVVLVESPTYVGALAAARAARISPVGVPIDHGGIRTDLLADAFAATGARAVYCQPTYQNPTGSVLAAERRREVLEIARDAGAFVIEDDYARWLGHERPARPPLIADDVDGRVVQIASITKVTSPNLRIGALIARGPVAERLRSLRIVDDFFVPRPLQEAAVELLGAASWASRLAALGRALTERRTVLLAALAEHLPQARPGRRPDGGLNVWVALPDGIDDLVLAQACRAAGVLISPGRPYHAAEPPRPYVRLSFAAAPDAAALEEGVRRLARAFAAVRAAT